jgi:hydrogenase nickel incorporation protein HypA/HybF
MHEFSLALNIIDLCEDALKEHHLRNISELVIEIGTLAGVDKEALETALESIKPNSILETSEITFVFKKAIATCAQCNATFEPEDSFSPCPDCNTYGIKLLAGQELIIKSITAE